MFAKPKNHKVRNPWPLILMIGIAALCLVLASQGMQPVSKDLLPL
ncbi:MAG: hypothetical protein ACK4HF_13685 [Paracoccaceae bacterium]